MATIGITPIVLPKRLCTFAQVREDPPYRNSAGLPNIRSLIAQVIYQVQELVAVLSLSTTRFDGLKLFADLLSARAAMPTTGFLVRRPFRDGYAGPPCVRHGAFENLCHTFQAELQTTTETNLR